MGLFRKKITKDQSRDTGMAMVLLALIGFVARKQQSVLIIAMVLHVINMITPQVYRPIAVLWFGLSELMGAVVSKVLLAIVFFTVVTPIAVLRRLAGKDSLRLHSFKIGRGSVMVERNHAFTGADLNKPY